MKRFVCHINNLLTRIGKPFMFTGIMLILLILPMACEEDDLAEADETEYTDVEYSKDGSSVTIYLDGKGVPKTRAQRAITADIAKTAFDLIEVIFINGAFATTGNVVRTSWILGQPANVFNIERGVNYSRCYPATPTDGTPATTGIAACMFVGRDDSKTLLGVGKLTGTRGTTTPAADPTYIDANTTSITFSIAAIQTGLLVGGLYDDAGVLVGGETLAGNTYGVVADSFEYYNINVSSTGVDRSPPPKGTVATGVGSDNKPNGNYVPGDFNNGYNYTETAGGYKSINGHSFRKTIAGKGYPVYLLPLAQDKRDNGDDLPTNIDITPDPSYTRTYAHYTFSFSGGVSMADTSEHKLAIRHEGTTNARDNIKVTKKTPRYVDGLRYCEPRSSIDTLTSARLASGYLNNRAVGFRFDNVVQIRFSTSASKGLFSFSLEIPVFMVSKTAAGRNNGTEAVIWKIRTGVGTEFYSIDDGVSRGGCVLIATGISSEEEFDTIEWTWFK